MNNVLPQTDPIDGYDLGEYRYAVARLVKLMIRARAKSDLRFLTDKQYEQWGLANIKVDGDSLELLLIKAKVAHHHLWNSYSGSKSGGIELNDPLADVKEQVLRFNLSCNPDALLATLQRGTPIDWPRAAAWELLPKLRAALDGLPQARRARSTPVSPIELGSSTSQPVYVLGKPKSLTLTRFNVVTVLNRSFPATLTKDQLVKESGHEDAVNILKRLKDTDDDWNAVIKLAVQTGGGYGIIDPVAD
jgi:hypothetical protein